MTWAQILWLLGALSVPAVWLFWRWFDSTEQGQEVAQQQLKDAEAELEARQRFSELPTNNNYRELPAFQSLPKTFLSAKHPFPIVAVVAGSARANEEFVAVTTQTIDNELKVIAVTTHRLIIGAGPQNPLESFEWSDGVSVSVRREGSKRVSVDVDAGGSRALRLQWRKAKNAPEQFIEALQAASSAPQLGEWPPPPSLPGPPSPADRLEQEALEPPAAEPNIPQFAEGRSPTPAPSPPAPPRVASAASQGDASTPEHQAFDPARVGFLLALVWIHVGLAFATALVLVFLIPVILDLLDEEFVSNARLNAVGVPSILLWFARPAVAFMTLVATALWTHRCYRFLAGVEGREPRMRGLVIALGFLVPPVNLVMPFVFVQQVAKGTSSALSDPLPGSRNRPTTLGGALWVGVSMLAIFSALPAGTLVHSQNALPGGSGDPTGMTVVEGDLVFNLVAMAANVILSISAGWLGLRFIRMMHELQVFVSEANEFRRSTLEPVRPAALDRASGWQETAHLDPTLDP